MNKLPYLMAACGIVKSYVFARSGLGMGDWKWTTDSIRPFVLDAISAFGTERCMFGSNFPVDKLFSSYDDVFNAFKTITLDFSDAERRSLFHDNAERIYRL